jgi:hypothetical protein
MNSTWTVHGSVDEREGRLSFESRTHARTHDSLARSVATLLARLIDCTRVTVDVAILLPRPARRSTLNTRHSSIHRWTVALCITRTTVTRTLIADWLKL